MLLSVHRFIKYIWELSWFSSLLVLLRPSGSESTSGNEVPENVIITKGKAHRTKISGNGDHISSVIQPRPCMRPLPTEAKRYIILTESSIHKFWRLSSHCSPTKIIFCTLIWTRKIWFELKNFLLTHASTGIHENPSISYTMFEGGSMYLI